MQVDVSNSKKAANVTISGLVIDDVNKPKSNLSIQLYTVPSTVPYSNLTNSSGIWLILDRALVRDTNYTLYVTYLNGKSQT